MKKKILFIPFVILIVVALDLVNRVFCTYAFNHVPEETKLYNLYGYQLNNQPCDILIAGASAARHGLNSKVFEDSLSLSCYNIALDGTNISYQYFCLRKALSHHPIKLFVLDVGDSQLSDSWVDKIQRYEPYYWQNSLAKYYMDRTGTWYLPYQMLSSFYQYNNRFFFALSSFVIKKKEGYKGYLPLQAEEGYNGIIPSDDKVFSPNDMLMEYLDLIVDCCSSNNVELLVTTSPRLYKNNSFTTFLSDYCRKKGVLYYNMSNKISDRKMFKDLVHLNERGAKLSTLMVLDYIKQHFPSLLKQPIGGVI